MANEGEISTSAVPASVAYRLQTYFSKRLLEVQQETLIFDQFGIKAELPRHSKSKTIRFHKPERADIATLRAAPYNNSAYSVRSLTEGTPPTVYRQNTWTYVDVTLAQYGEVTKLTDVLTMIDAYEPLRQNIELMGRDAALSADTLVRNAIHTGTLNDDLSYKCELFASGGTAGAFSFPADSSAAFTTLSAAEEAVSLMTRNAILLAVTRLKADSAPKYRGNRYVCAVCPQVAYDLFKDSDYKNYAFQGQGNAQGFWKGHLGTLDGVDFVEHTNPFIEDETYGTYDSTDDDSDGLIWSTYVFGMGSYGIPNMAGSNSPFRPQVVINDKPDKSDPLNQFVIAGWKAFYAATCLDKTNMVVIRTKSTYA